LQILKITWKNKTFENTNLKNQFLFSSWAAKTKKIKKWFQNVSNVGSLLKNSSVKNIVQ